MNVHAKSRLTLEPLRTLRSETTGAGRGSRARTRTLANPLHGIGGHTTAVESPFLYPALASPRTHVAVGQPRAPSGADSNGDSNSSSQRQTSATGGTHNTRTIRGDLAYVGPEKTDGRTMAPFHRVPGIRTMGACPRDAFERPSTANDRHQQQPAKMKLPRALKPRATHGNTLVMRRSLGGDEDQGAEAPTVVRDRRRRARCVPDRPGQRRELTVTPGQPDTPAHLRTGRLTRCANRPSKLVSLPAQ